MSTERKKRRGSFDTEAQESWTDSPEGRPSPDEARDTARKIGETPGVYTPEPEETETPPTTTEDQAADPRWKPRAGEGRTRVSLDLESELYEALRRLAAATGQSGMDILRLALADYLARFPQSGYGNE